MRPIPRGLAVSVGIGVLVVAMLSAAPFVDRRSVQASANGLAVQSQTCIPETGRIEVRFNWTPAQDGEQWLDLSLFDNGFAAGSFLGMGPLTANTEGAVWTGLLPGRLHFARVNVATATGWSASSTVAFTTPACNAPAASVAVASQACSQTLPGRVTITIAWAPGGSGQQWVDLSLSNNGFQPWTFINTGPLAPETATVVWDGLIQNSTHYLRINTLTPVGWMPSGTIAFTTPNCGPSSRRTITLSFDDGGPYADDILDILDQKGVRAIFFPYGSWAVANAALLERMKSSGHLVGNHTYSHVNLTLLGPEQVRAEIAGGNIGNSNLFRPVYGIINATVQAIAEEMGFRVFMWNIDPRDWEKTYPGGDRDILNEVVRQAFPGAVVLLHMQSANTAVALPALIDSLRASGYEVTW